MTNRILSSTLERLHKNSYQTLNIIEIKASALLNNVQVFQSLKPNNYLMAVLKSNAYGHGLIAVTKILNQAKIEFIAVDGYFEANKILYKTKHKILVMGYILPTNVNLLDSKKCSYVVQDITSLEAMGKTNKKFNIHLEINSGMNRLGLVGSELKPYLKTLKLYPNLNLEGVMSHLADADNPNNAYTNRQIAIFDKTVELIIKQGFKPKYIHLAQSAGSVKNHSKLTNTSRIGIGLYGINPLSKQDHSYLKLDNLQPVLELKSTIIKILKLGQGEKISYNGIYQTIRPTKIGVLPLGYYEWVPRELSNIGKFTYKNHHLPIRGRVCMNHTMVDLGRLKIKVGDQITIISNNKNAPNSIESMAKEFNLFSYSLLTRLAESIRRVIV